jgi:hypothetical protein
VFLLHVKDENNLAKQSVEKSLMSVKAMLLNALHVLVAINAKMENKVF